MWGTMPSLSRTLAFLVVAVAAAASSCKTEPAVDAGHTAAVAADAGAAPVVDAGNAPAGDAGTIGAASDAGAANETGAAAAADAGAASSAHEDVGHPAGGLTASVFDRLLIKPKDPNTSAEDVKALVEKKLGVKVSAVRKTAVKWILVTLAPASRTAADQQKAIDALKTVDAFAAVEGDRMMKVR
jgi:hypothetical protein